MQGRRGARSSPRVWHATPLARGAGVPAGSRMDRHRGGRSSTARASDCESEGTGSIPVGHPFAGDGALECPWLNPVERRGKRFAGPLPAFAWAEGRSLTGLGGCGFNSRRAFRATLSAGWMDGDRRCARSSVAERFPCPRTRPRDRADGQGLSTDNREVAGSIPAGRSPIDTRGALRRKTGGGTRGPVAQR